MNDDPVAIPSLRISHLRLHLQPEQPLQLPANNKGNSLRGGFGSAFRKLVCVDLSWECAQCSLRFQCPYTQVFNPFLPPDATQLTGNPNIPRPFVVKPPLTAQTTYAPGESVVFDLVVAGRAVDYLPYFIVAFRELGANGFGLNRARVALARVDAVAADGSLTTVYEGTSNLVRPPTPFQIHLIDTPDACRPSPILSPVEGPVVPSDTLTLHFLTPTTLKSGSSPGHEGEAVRHPAFHHVLKRLRDRVNALSTFYGDGPLNIDFKALGTAAEEIRTVEDATRWVDRSRFTRRRGVTHDLSGFAGRLTVQGNLQPFLTLLRAGEYLHIGKNAVFGNGWLRIEAATPRH
ncbi:MAG: CRISPR system precrRNA processing endoribonuclease RAMP protein Cas6 [Deltaproteobacteria bacterium]|nr:CRISPR system precrRNA processing endoribonuclease RAMP protein Cas6 [Deltaproteobacteria bacterium]